jgi:hypothetical protein
MPGFNVGPGKMRFIAKLGRNPDDIKVLYLVYPFLGETNRRRGASRRPAAAPPLYARRPASSPRHWSPAMKRIFARSRCQGRPLPAALCTGQKNWKKQIRVRCRYEPSTALRSLTERPVFSLRRREFLRIATG